MNFRPYIDEAAAAFPKVMTPEMISRGCAAFGFSVTAFSDAFAMAVAREYLDGKLSWSDADAAMNGLSGYFSLHLPTEVPFPDYAWGIYLAFDAGEIAQDPERVTKEQLADCMQKRPNQPPEPTRPFGPSGSS